MNKKYGFWHLVIDIVLTLATGGLWLIVPIVKYLRRNTPAR